MSAQHPYAPPVDRASAAGAAGADRFVSLRLPARGATTSTTSPAAPGDEVVLARIDDELRPDAVVVARRAGGRAGAREDAPGDELEVRRVGRVTPESVELLPLGDGADGTGDAGAAVRPRVVPRTADAVVGTVVLRWSAG